MIPVNGIVKYGCERQRWFKKDALLSKVELNAFHPSSNFPKDRGRPPVSSNGFGNMAPSKMGTLEYGRESQQRV